MVPVLRCAMFSPVASETRFWECLRRNRVTLFDGFRPCLLLWFPSSQETCLWFPSFVDLRLLCCHSTTCV